MKKKHKFKIAYTIIIAIFTFSCSNYLDVTPDATLTSENSYNSAQDLENALIGAYSAFYLEYYQWDNVLLSDVRSDNAYSGGGGDAPIAQYDKLTINIGNNRMFDNWSQLYQGIARCNLILDKINNVDDPLLNKDNLREKIIGQARFLRAFHYFQLVKTFGAIPIELHSNSTDASKINLPRASEEEVYNQINTDLEVALKNLPDFYGNTPSENKTKATKGAANALLSKCWAQRKNRDYNKVLQYCNAVINSPAAYSLMTNYSDLFDGEHYANSESIMEIAFLANGKNSNWATQLFLAPEDGWQKYCIPSHDLINAYEAENDLIRKNANIIFINHLNWSDENWNPCADENTSAPFNYKQKHPNNWNSSDHLYLLRLADILLLKAEAQNELNDLNEALRTLNLVRKRAKLNDLTTTSKADLKTKILNERRLELAFEGHRWDDLVRANECTNVMNNLKEVKYFCGNGTISNPILINYNCTNEKWLCPIPQLERDANPNLTQNPGY